MKLSPARAGLFVVDIQDRLAPAIDPGVLAAVLRNVGVLIEAAHRLHLPIVVSQQYPKGLGPTVKAVEDGLAGKPVHRFDKLEFSAAAAPAFGELAPKLARDQWIVCGMETHICVYQTARDLVARGYAVHVVADAVCSRASENWQIGKGLCERAGAVITATETCVFDLLHRAGSDDFKALSKLIK